MTQEYMKALCYMGPADLQLHDMPVPECGEEDIILEIKGAAICGADMHWKSGAFTAPNSPFVLGHEFAGVICKKGERVSDYWNIGDRVVSDNTGAVCGHCSACISGNQVHCLHRGGLGSGMDGGFAKYCRIPGEVLRVFPEALMKVPDNISFEEAAVLEPAANSYKAAIQEAGIMPGDTVVVYGLGPLGLLPIQLARIAGASTIIAVGMKSDKAVRFPLAEKFGATHVLASDDDDVPSEILRLVGEDAVRIVIDAVGVPSIMNSAFSYMCHDGKYVRIGNVKADYGYSLLPLIDKQITVIGHMGYNPMSWRYTMNLVAHGQLDLKSLISHVMPLAEHEKAYEMVRTQQASKIVLIP